MGSIGLHHQLTLNVGSTTNKGVVDGALAINRAQQVSEKGGAFDCIANPAPDIRPNA